MPRRKLLWLCPSPPRIVPLGSAASIGVATSVPEGRHRHIPRVVTCLNSEDHPSPFGAATAPSLSTRTAPLQQPLFQRLLDGPEHSLPLWDRQACEFSCSSQLAAWMPSKLPRWEICRDWGDVSEARGDVGRAVTMGVGGCLHILAAPEVHPPSLTPFDLLALDVLECGGRCR